MAGNVKIGGGAPVTVQSMTNTDTRDPEATLAQIERLARAGCEIVRVAVPDEAAARALKPLVARSPLPLVADIHFDHRLALAALEAGVFDEEIVPVHVEQKKKSFDFARDEFPRPGTTMDVLGKLRPAFKKDGVVTAGNASGGNAYYASAGNYYASYGNASSGNAG